MKTVLILAGVLGLSVGIAMGASVNPASNVTADSANTANTIVYRDGSGNFAAGQITAAGIVNAGPTNLQSKTLAQLLAIAPAVGDAYYCSNCSPAKIVVATGTAAGNFADAVGGTFK